MNDAQDDKPLLSAEDAAAARELKSLNNEEFVADLMLFSPYGALCQAFILEGIRHYAEIVSKSTPKDNPDAFVNPMIWHGIAVDIDKKMRLRNS